MPGNHRSNGGDKAKSDGLGINSFRGLLNLSVLIFMGIFAWRVGERLSVDALSMIVGVMLGLLAVLPAAFLIVLSGRGRTDRRRQDRPKQATYQYRGMPQHDLTPPPPVIVVTGAGGAHAMPLQSQAQGHAFGQAGHYPALTMQRSALANSARREFNVVGEEQGWLDEPFGGSG